MKVKIRRSSQDDLEDVFALHAKCFAPTDQWYRYAIKNYLDKGIVIVNKENNNLIGVMLQGPITPCNPKFNPEESTFMSDDKKDNNYKEDIFEPTDDIGKMLLENKTCYAEMYGIVMICVDPDFRGKGLAQKLIEKHFIDNPDRIICLNTRRSNINAYSLYKKMGYYQVAFIKNKYFLPDEDSIFMIKDLTEY